MQNSSYIFYVSRFYSKLKKNEYFVIYIIKTNNKIIKITRQ